MNCVQCSNTIPRGTRFKTEQYKTLCFCSEECFNKYVEQKKKPPKKEEMPYLRQLTDYIKAVYPYEPNWAAVVKQIKSITKEYGIGCKEILLTIKYAVEYEHYTVDGNYLLGQFIPRFLDEAMNFLQEIRKNRDLAEKYNPEDTYYVVRKNKKTFKNKNCEW